jgi:hypothetical protein
MFDWFKVRKFALQTKMPLSEITLTNDPCPKCETKQFEYCWNNHKFCDKFNCWAKIAEEHKSKLMRDTYIHK